MSEGEDDGYLACIEDIKKCKLDIVEGEKANSMWLIVDDKYFLTKNKQFEGCSPLAPFTRARLFLLLFPVYLASLPRLFCLTTPTIESPFPDYRVFCFFSPTIESPFPDYNASLAHK